MIVQLLGRHDLGVQRHVLRRQLADDAVPFPSQLDPPLLPRFAVRRSRQRRQRFELLNRLHAQLLEHRRRSAHHHDDDHNQQGDVSHVALPSLAPAAAAAHSSIPAARK